jgi:hypothetical protein
MGKWAGNAWKQRKEERCCCAFEAGSRYQEGRQMTSDDGGKLREGYREQVIDDGVNEVKMG